MSRFEFRYQSILNHREKIEQQRKRALARHLHRRNELVGRLRRMQETISRAKREAGDALVGAVDLSAIAGIARYSARCTAEGHGLVREVAALETTVEQARKELLEASRERQALELLRDRQQQAYELEQRRMEAKRLDELTSQAYARRVMAEPTSCEPSSPRSPSSLS